MFWLLIKRFLGLQQEQRISQELEVNLDCAKENPEEVIALHLLTGHKTVRFSHPNDFLWDATISNLTTCNTRLYCPSSSTYLTFLTNHIASSEIHIYPALRKHI